MCRLRLTRPSLAILSRYLMETSLGDQQVSLNKAIHLIGSASSDVIAGLSGALSITFTGSGTIEVSRLNFSEGSFAVDYQGLVNIDGNSTGQPANQGVLLLPTIAPSRLPKTARTVSWSKPTAEYSTTSRSFRTTMITSVSTSRIPLGSTQPGDPWQTPSTMGTSDSTGLANTT